MQSSIRSYFEDFNTRKYAEKNPPIEVATKYVHVAKRINEPLSDGGSISNKAKTVNKIKIQNFIDFAFQMDLRVVNRTMTNT